jgi:hypothetical protein
MGALQGAQAEIEFDLLEAVLSRQTSGNAAAGGASVLRAFRALLASLVGPALSERLLRTVWLQFVSASPTQDGSL